MRFLWLALGWSCVGLGVVGAFLPLLPTTPFLLLAAFAFSRGSEQLHTWLIEHPQLGPPIRHWHSHGAISKQVKIIATATMAILFVISFVMAVPIWVLLSQAVILTGVGCFLWTRKNPPASEDPSPSPSPSEKDP